MTNRRARKKLSKLYLKIRSKRIADNKLCYKATKEFMRLYSQCKPDKENHRESKEIKICTFLIREALNRKDYVELLHEIQKLCYLRIIHHLNVKTALTDLLDKYVDKDLEVADG